MIYYIENMIDNIPEYMRGGSATPAAHHLFFIVEDAIKLSQANADKFSPYCSATTISFEDRTPRHPDSNILHVYYSDRA